MMNETVQSHISNFWSQSANRFDTNASHVAHPDNWLKVLAAAFQSDTPKDIIDLGTGTGACAIIAAKLGHRVRAYDGADGMLDAANHAAKAAGVTVSFLPGVIEHTDIPAASADIITVRNVLWTVEDPMLFLQKAKTVLRPNGLLLVSDGEWAASPGYRTAYAPDVAARLPFHDGLSEAQAKALLLEAGFNTLQTWQHLFTTPPYPNQVPMFVMTARH